MIRTFFLTYIQWIGSVQFSRTLRMAIHCVCFVERRDTFQPDFLSLRFFGEEVEHQGPIVNHHRTTTYVSRTICAHG